MSLLAGGTMTEYSGPARRSRGGGTVHVREPACGFFIAGSSLDELNGIFGRINRAKVKSERTVDLAYRHDHSRWLMLLRERSNFKEPSYDDDDYDYYGHQEPESRWEWVFQDPTGRDRFTHKGNSIIPGAGTRWAFAHTTADELAAAAGGGGASAKTSHQKSTALAEVPEDDEETLPWQVIALLEQSVVRDLRASYNYRAKRVAMALAGLDVEQPSSTSVEAICANARDARTAAASAAAVKAAEEGEGGAAAAAAAVVAAAPDDWWLYRVVVEAGVALRGSASEGARELGRRRCGDLVRVREERADGWMLLSVEEKARPVSEVAVGDRVAVTGEHSTYKGESGTVVRDLDEMREFGVELHGYTGIGSFHVSELTREAEYDDEDIDMDGYGGLSSDEEDGEGMVSGGGSRGLWVKGGAAAVVRVAVEEMGTVVMAGVEAEPEAEVEMDKPFEPRLEGSPEDVAAAEAAAAAAEAAAEAAAAMSTAATPPPAPGAAAAAPTPPASVHELLEKGAVGAAAADAARKAGHTRSVAEATAGVRQLRRLAQDCGGSGDWSGRSLLQLAGVRALLRLARVDEALAEAKLAVGGGSTGVMMPAAATAAAPASTQLWLAHCLLRKGRRDAAIEAMERAAAAPEELDPAVSTELAATASAAAAVAAEAWARGAAAALLRAVRQVERCRVKAHDAYVRGAFKDASALYMEALNATAGVGPGNGLLRGDKWGRATLHAAAASCYRRARQLPEAIAQCDASLALYPRYTRALFRRAACFLEVGQPVDALAAFVDLLRVDRKWPGLCEWLVRSKAQLRRQEQGKKFGGDFGDLGEGGAAAADGAPPVARGPVDHYAALGVTSDATETQLKKAYRLMSLKTHPDKKGGSTEMFQRVGKAYEVLSDPEKREAYNNGADVRKDQGSSDEEFEGEEQSLFEEVERKYFPGACCGRAARPRAPLRAFARPCARACLLTAVRPAHPPPVATPPPPAERYQFHPFGDPFIEKRKLQARRRRQAGKPEWDGYYD